ncbi:recombinase family protein [Kitasatospora sp. A2-31]|uniref:recombinase family protein n=1 Tax=Kitasatospora sp. A2-31 TaxID=2916414 RepID=UPI001EEBC4ED|nr:recombinase family protein [Kitasatospora sp. A2-31]MCG6497647.1 recombinase family protein [Kitasatospora sp. A2-31]
MNAYSAPCFWHERLRWACRVRAALYLRISSDPTGRAAGVQRQEEDCRALADSLGWDIVAVHRDNDISAYAGKPRPGYRALLQDLRDGHVQAVVAWHSDRLYRRLPDLEELVKVVQETGAVIRTCKAGVIDLSTASGVMTAEIQASVAKHEVAHSIERISAAKRQAAEQGKYRGGPRPFGYGADGATPRTLLCPSCEAPQGFDTDRICQACGTEALNAPESEAWWTEQATKAVVAGDSLASIERTWAAAGVRTVARRYRQEDGTRGEPEDRPWKREEIRKLLLRPRNAGLMEVTAIGPDGKKQSDIAGRAGWAPIVDEDTWYACRAILTNPARRTTTGNGRKWLGSGLYACWCGSTVRCSTTGIGGTKKAQQTAARAAQRNGVDTEPEKAKTHRPAYRCNASTSHAIRDAASLDGFIEGHAILRLARPDAAELLLPPQQNGDKRHDLAATANALRAKLDGFTQDYSEDLITRQQMLDGTALTRKRLEKVEAQMAALASTSVLASLPLGDPQIGTLWKRFDIDKKQSIIRALMTVTIHKARRGRPPGFKPGTGQTYFDESTIAIDWKRPSQ